MNSICSGIAVSSTITALEDLGWIIEHKVDPAVYEQGSIESAEEQRVLLLTQIRQTPMFLGTRYAKLNVYIKSLKGVSEIEIRYLTVTSVFFKTFQTYQNDKAVERIFRRIRGTIRGCCE